MAPIDCADSGTGEGDGEPDRLGTAERILASTAGARAAEARIAAELGCTRREAKRYARAVRRLWRIEAQRAEGDGERAERRAELRARLERLYELALERRRAFVSEGAVLDVADPDVKAATAVVQRLLELDGLTSPAALVQIQAPTNATATASPIDIAEAKRRLRMLKGEHG